jgi:hypothetical protein
LTANPYFENGIKKTVTLSPHNIQKDTPSSKFKVLPEETSPADYAKGKLPLSVLLEGSFESI